MRKTSTLELDHHPSFSKVCTDLVIAALLEISSGKPAICPTLWQTLLPARREYAPKMGLVLRLIRPIFRKQEKTLRANTDLGS